MSDIAIRVENLSKQYRIGSAKERYTTLRERLVAGATSLVRRTANGRKPETIWALSDVSFEVQTGEVLGIIGHNGAGKSTLLKILSRITEPTAGRARLHGRVGCLLEVGTGFHSELTGRENIYLNGVILGMKRSDVDQRFDEIVAFAGVEKFLDTQVKHYSSGMHMRLAFAVAAHLEPEILILDEVLAVGDAAFQKKCLGKMGEVAREGRTVLFVSHNMGAVANLCASALWLDDGKVVKHDAAAPTISAYVKSISAVSRSDTTQWKRRGTGEARITEARLLDTAGNPCTTFSMGETLVVEFDAEFHRSFQSINCSMEIQRTDMGLRVLHMESQDCGFVIEDIAPGKRRFRVEIPNCLLYPASYQIMLCFWAPGATFDYVADVLSFSMVQSDVSKRTAPLSLHKQAVFFQPSTWQEIP